MSPTWVNGRALGVASNGVFNSANTDPIFEGLLWPEAAETWNAMRAAALKDGIQPWEFAPAGPNSSARGRPAQDFFWAHQPPPAAPPYTSNHGWAIAVDCKTRRAAAWILNNGHRFGWSWDEGQRVGEWWHMRYVGVSRARLAQIRRAANPFSGLGRKRRKAVLNLYYWRRKAIQEARGGKGRRYKHAVNMRDHLREVVEGYYRHARRGKQKRLLLKALKNRTGQFA